MQECHVSFLFRNKLNSARQGFWSWYTTFLSLILHLTALQGAVQLPQSSLPSNTFLLLSALGYQCQLSRFLHICFLPGMPIWCCAEQRCLHLQHFHTEAPSLWLSCVKHLTCKDKASFYAPPSPADCIYLGSCLFSAHLFCRQRWWQMSLDLGWQVIYSMMYSKMLSFLRQRSVLEVTDCSSEWCTHHSSFRTRCHIFVKIEWAGKQADTKLPLFLA